MDPPRNRTDRQGQPTASRRPETPESTIPSSRQTASRAAPRTADQTFSPAQTATYGRPAEYTAPRMGNESRPAVSAQGIAQYRSNEYWVPREGIDREVITADIVRYLGNDASVRSAFRANPETGVREEGYFITGYRDLTTAMIADLKADSKRWEDERRKTIPRDRPAYDQSQIHQSRQYYGPTDPVNSQNSAYTTQPMPSDQQPGGGYDSGNGYPPGYAPQASGGPTGGYYSRDAAPAPVSGYPPTQLSAGYPQQSSAYGGDPRYQQNYGQQPQGYLAGDPAYGTQSYEMPRADPRGDPRMAAGQRTSDSQYSTASAGYASQQPAGNQYYPNQAGQPSGRQQTYPSTPAVDPYYAQQAGAYTDPATESYIDDRRIDENNSPISGDSRRDREGRSERERAQRERDRRERERRDRERRRR